MFTFTDRLGNLWNLEYDTRFVPEHIPFGEWYISLYGRYYSVNRDIVKDWVNYENNPDERIEKQLDKILER